ncbi:Protein MLT-10, partial [Aphelenchoides avenae]
ERPSRRLMRYRSPHRDAGSTTNSSWRGAFRLMRRKRAITSKSHYGLKSRTDSASPLGAVARLLNSAVLASKNKSTSTPWQFTLEKLRRHNEAKKKAEQEAEDADDAKAESIMFKGMRNQMMGSKSWRQQQAAASAKRDPTARLMGLLRDGFKMGYTLAGQNTSKFENSTLKVLSPEFFSVSPKEGKAEEENLLSPSLLSLHGEGTGAEQLTSLPNLMRGLGDHGHNEWLNLIFEAANITEAAEDLLKNPKPSRREALTAASPQYEKEVRSDDGTPLYFTKENVTEMYGDHEGRKIDVFQQLQLSLRKEQVDRMNSTGYAMLTYKQLELLYGPHSPYNNSEALARLLAVNHSDLHDHLEEDIHRLAEAESFKLRQKDIVLSPIVLSSIVGSFSVGQSVILSPLLLSPIVLSPSVLGPVILSPWLFVPVILSPRAMSPLILSPAALSPVVLSPVVLHPLILSPAVMCPFILTPFALSPFILSPVCMIPVILCPLTNVVV